MIIMMCVFCRFEIALEGLDSGHALLVGFCVPLAAGPEDLVLSGHPHPVERDTYHQLRQDNSGAGYYWDRQVGIIFRRFQNDVPRLPESREACVGGLCPSFRIDIRLFSSNFQECERLPRCH